jgi:hypothetical protein
VSQVFRRAEDRRNGMPKRSEIATRPENLHQMPLTALVLAVPVLFGSLQEGQPFRLKSGADTDTNKDSRECLNKCE